MQINFDVVISYKDMYANIHQNSEVQTDKNISSLRDQLT